jgi:hypothetical protein
MNTTAQIQLDAIKKKGKLHLGFIILYKNW